MYQLSKLREHAFYEFLFATTFGLFVFLYLAWLFSGMQTSTIARWEGIAFCGISILGGYLLIIGWRLSSYSKKIQTTYDEAVARFNRIFQKTADRYSQRITKREIELNVSRDLLGVCKDALNDGVKIDTINSKLDKLEKDLRVRFNTELACYELYYYQGWGEDIKVIVTIPTS